MEEPELRRRRSEALRFRMVDGRGQTVRDFDVEHTGRLHLIVARRDLTGSQHLHPERQADGGWSVELRLDEAGSYRRPRPDGGLHPGGLVAMAAKAVNPGGVVDPGGAIDPSGTSIEHVDLPVTGMTCASCANRIERKLNRLDGVTATVDYATGKATVVYDTTAVEPEQLIGAVEAAGYQAVLLRTSPPASWTRSTRPRRCAGG